MDGQFYTSTYVKPTNTGLYLLCQVLLITRVKRAYFIAYCFAHLGFVLTGCYSIMRLLG